MGEEMPVVKMDVRVTSPTTLSNSFVGETFQICVVTADIYRTLEQFVRIGIGPWKIYTFDDNLIEDLRYRGEKNGHSARLAVAWSGAMWWEVIQPLTGDSIYSEWLEKHGDSIHHVAVDCKGIGYEDRIKEFVRRGYTVTQSGRFMGQVPYCYVDTENSTGFGVELVELPENFSLPEPEEWYPGPPPA